MHVKHLGELFPKVLGRARIEPAAEHPVVRERRVSATALMLWAVALGVLIGVRWGMAGLACYLPWLPFAFVIIWGSTTALRFDEREVPETMAPERAREAFAELGQRQAPAR